jgi:hypothetical protein
MNARLVSSKESRSAVRFLVRDLVLLHKPVEAKGAGEGRAEAVASEHVAYPSAPARQPNKPSGFSRVVQIALAGAAILGDVLNAQCRRHDKRG